MGAKRVSYARKTEATRDDIRARSHAARWYARKSQPIPDELVNGTITNTTGSLRHHLAAECGRYYAGEERKGAIANGIITGRVVAPNQILLRHAKAIVEAAKAKGLVRDTPIAIFYPRRHNSSECVARGF